MLDPILGPGTIAWKMVENISIVGALTVLQGRRNVNK